MTDERLLLAPGVALLCFACATADQGTGPSCTVTSVTLNAPTPPIVVGQSFTLTATVTATQCDPVPVASWSNGNPAAVSMVPSGNQAEITALTPSAALVTITATAGSEGASVQFTVVPKPAIALSPPTLAFAATQGGPNPPTQDVTITNSGGSTLTNLSLGAITYGPGASAWLTVPVAPGSTAAPSAAFTVRALTGSLAAGTYTATIPVEAAGASNSPRNVTVTFTISAPLAGNTLTVVSGNTRTGLVGRATADSLLVRYAAR